LTAFYEVRHTKQHPSHIQDMATWPTDIRVPASILMMLEKML
jgi:hypothetical protein